jgi:hypothetical protein
MSYMQYVLMWCDMSWQLYILRWCVLMDEARDHVIYAKFSRAVTYIMDVSIRSFSYYSYFRRTCSLQIQERVHNYILMKQTRNVKWLSLVTCICEHTRYMYANYTHAHPNITSVLYTMVNEYIDNTHDYVNTRTVPNHVTLFIV